MKPVLWSLQNCAKKQQEERIIGQSFLMKIDTKILIKYLQAEFNNTSKESYYHAQVGIIPAIQGWFNIGKLINVILHITESRTKIT
jgi:hypothetical protein